MSPDSQSPAVRRHRALAGISRSRLLAVLQAVDHPIGIRELADAVNLHPNTAREHLDLLVEAGLVRRERAAAARRGRPSLCYRAEPRERPDGRQAYRALAAALADDLAQRPDAHAAATRAGERWGAAAVNGLPAAREAADPVERLVALLDDAGFAPSRAADAVGEIELRRCPFGSLARERTEIVCNVHLGLMRGALRELGAPLDAVSLRPFVRPDLCVAELGARNDG